VIDNSNDIQTMIINYIVRNKVTSIDENINDNKNIMIEAIKNNVTLFDSLSDNLKNDKEFIMSLLDVNERYLFIINEKFYDDDDIATLIVEKYPEEYNMLSLRQKNNRDLALQCLKKANIYKYLPSTFKSDMEFLKEGFKYGGIFKTLSNELRSNKEVIMEALKYDANVVKQIYFKEPDKAKDFFTDEIIEEMLSINGLAIAYLDENIKSNRKYAMMAIKQNPKSIKFIDKQLYTDYEIIMTALKNDSSLISLIDTIDYNIALKLVKDNPNNYSLLKNNMDDYEIILETLKQDGYKLFMVDATILENNNDYSKLAMEAVKQNGKALKFISYKCDNYYEICEAAIKQNAYAYSYIRNDFVTKNEYSKLLLLALTINSLIFNDSYYFQGNKEYIKIALKKNPNIINNLITNEVKYGLKLEK
jgi:hypothetical protein